MINLNLNLNIHNKFQDKKIEFESTASADLKISLESKAIIKEIWSSGSNPGSDSIFLLVFDIVIFTRHKLQVWFHLQIWFENIHLLQIKAHRRLALAKVILIQSYNGSYINVVISYWKSAGLMQNQIVSGKTNDQIKMSSRFFKH